MSTKSFTEEVIQPFASLLDEINNYFDLDKQPIIYTSSLSSFPKVSITLCADKTLVIQAAISGYTKKDIEIKIENDVLVISSEKAPQIYHGKILLNELKHSSFKRRFKLSKLLDQKSISAKCEDGLLTISLDVKKPEVNSYTVNVE